MLFIHERSAVDAVQKYVTKTARDHKHGKNGRGDEENIIGIVTEIIREQSAERSRERVLTLLRVFATIPIIVEQFIETPYRAEVIDEARIVLEEWSELKIIPIAGYTTFLSRRIKRPTAGGSSSPASTGNDRVGLLVTNCYMDIHQFPG